MGGKTQTSTSTVQIPPEVLARYNAVNARAENVAQTPFQAYSSDPNAFVAPMTGTQQQAIGQIGQASTMAQPYFQTGAAATMAGMGPANLGALETERYLSPYLRNVAQTTADIMGQDFGQQMSGALGTAIQSGAGFGDRSGIAAANLARQQQMGLGSTISNILNQGYQQAQGVAQQQQSADLASRQANLARLMQGGQGLAGIGAGAQGAALAGGQALLGAGTQEQQTQQAGLSALYNQFLQERAYPFQVAQFLGNLAMGTGALSGSTTTTTQPAGFFSGFKEGGKVIEGSYRRGGLVPESMGGHVGAEHTGEGYADGGAPVDYATMVMQQLFGGTDPSAGAYGLNKMGLGASSYIPKGDLPVSQLMVADPVPAPEQTSVSDIADVASSLTDTADRGRTLWEEFNKRDEGYARGGLAAGGMPYDPESTGYVPDNTPGKTPELLQPKTPETNQESGLGKVADIAKLAMMFMGMNRGGSAYADGGYVVERGDTLSGIARKHGRSLEDILSANPELRKNPDLIQIGQRVMLPQDAQAAGTPFPPRPSEFPARPGLAGSMPRTETALPANYEFPTAGFGEERYPGSYMSDRSQKGLMDLLKLEAMRREGNYASGGVAGRSGYLDGGFASDAALAALARKKKEQDILNELGSSDWAGGLGANQPASAPAPAPGGLSAGQAALAATGQTAPSPLTYRAEQSPLERQAADVRVNEAMKNIGSDIFSRYPDLGPFNVIGDMTLKPSEMEAVNAQRAERKAMEDWYNSQRGYFAQNPNELARAKADPFAYYQKGIVPAATGITANTGLSAAALPPVAEPVPAATGVTIPGVVTSAGAAEMPVAATPEAGLAGAKAPAEAKPGVGSLDDLWENVKVQESGNRHFRADGSLIVGDNGKSIGISQIQDAAAREAADFLGIEYDPQRLASDPAYNETLGKGYLTKMYQKYGSPELAAAAYNAGPGNVDAALAKSRETGRPWQEFIPSSTRGYIANVTGGELAPGGVGGGGVSAQGVSGTTAGGLGGLGGMFDQAVAQSGGAENIVLPFLAGLGKMAGSRSRFLGTAILEGIGGGAEAYMNRQSQLANIAQTQAMTRGTNIDNVGRSIRDIGGVNYVVTANGGLQQFNDWLSNPSAPIAGGEAVNAMARLVGQQLMAQNGTANTGDVNSVLQTVQTTPRGVEGGAGMPVAPTQAAEPTNVIWDPRTSTAADRADKLMSSPNARELITTSAALLNDVTVGGETAGSNRLNIAEQAMAVSALMGAPPLESFGAQGAGRAAITKALNLASQSLGLGPVSDMATQTDILDKLRFAQANNLVNASNQDSYNALEAAAGMMPNIEQDPVAAATIMSTLMVDNQRAIDRSAFYNAFADQTTSKILLPAGAEFNRLYDNVYKQEVAYLRDLLSNPQAAPYIQGAMKASTPEEAQRILSNAFGGKPIPPKLHRYFVAGGAI